MTCRHDKGQLSLAFLLQVHADACKCLFNQKHNKAKASLSSTSFLSISRNESKVYEKAQKTTSNAECSSMKQSFTIGNQNAYYYYDI